MALVKYNNNSISDVTATAGLASGGMNLITTNTISSGVSSSNFTSNINSTYDTYMFKFINIHPSADFAILQVNFSTDGGSNYNLTKTTTCLTSWVKEAGGSHAFQYRVSLDLAQSTAAQEIMSDIGNSNDECCSGTMFLFSPSNTTFVKHFITDIQNVHGSNYSMREFISGYVNTTSDIDAVQFSVNSGTIDSGVIKMYGLSKS